MLLRGVAAVAMLAAATSVVTGCGAGYLGDTGLPLALVSDALPVASVGSTYHGSVAIAGGIAPYTCSIAGGSLPNGLSLNGCTVSGTATTAGTTSVTVKVTDAGLPAGQISGPVHLGVVAQVIGSGLTITTSSLPDATLGLTYSAAIDVSGGTAPYACAVSSGSLPSGLSLNGCAIGGRMTSASASTFTISATDASSPSQSVEGKFTIKLAAPPLSLLTSVLANGTVGVNYSTRIAVLGGVAPYTCSVAGGALDAGLVLNGCTVSGTPTAAGSGSLTLLVTDAQKPAAQRTGTVAWTVLPGGLAVTTKSLPAGTVGTAYNALISAAGGTPPYACGVVSGTLPAGVALSGCSLSGVPSAASATPVTIRVSDAGSPAAQVSASFVVSIAASSLRLTTTGLPPGTAGAAYNASLAISGGTAPYVCSVTGGALPNGVTLNGCIVAGTPTAAGTGSATIAVTDASSPTMRASSNVAWTVSPATLVLLTTILPRGTAGATYAAPISATGGLPPYACSVANGSLPTGLVLQGCSILGKPTGASSQYVTLRMTDAGSPAQSVTETVDLTVAPAALKVGTASLPPGTVQVPYSASLSIMGGVAPYSCSLASGSLPSGLQINQCTIRGTPAASGTSTVTVKVMDAGSPASSASGSWTIAVAGAPLQLETAALPNGTAGVFYSSSVAATGGTAPYHCGLSNGALPSGLGLSGCAITGTPASASSTTATVVVTDASQPVQTVSGTVTLQIAPPALTLANATLPTAITGQAYAGSLSATGGTAPYSYSVASGALPAGLVLGPDGSIAGIATAAGTGNFTIRVTDASSPQESVTRPLVITVQTPALVLRPATLSAATIGQAYSASLAISGGTTPYSCKLLSGALPAGLSLNGCTITGTATSTGGATVSVMATDASNPLQTVSASIVVPVNAQPLQITTTQLPAASVNTPYAAAFSTSGGVGTVSCAVTAGSLPAGLLLHGCAISGTPTVAETSPLTITASDTRTPAADTASAVLSLTVSGGPLTVATATLATPVLGQAYSQSLQVIGGQAPYTYSVTAGALPRGLTLAANGVLTGTPTAAGASSFTVSVTDGAVTSQTVVQSYMPLVVYPAGRNDAQLSGPFAFLVQGFDAAANGDLPYQTATVGSFVADGAGLLQQGEMDSNHESPTANAGQTAHFLGTYEVGDDQRGLLTITVLHADGTTGASSTYEIAAGAEIAADGSQSAATVAAEGGLPLQSTGAPGMLLAQDKTAFANGLKGSYAFGLEGDTPCLMTCVTGIVGGPAAEVGQFTTDGSGAIVSGTADSNIAATNYANTTLSGSYGTADANGRLAMTLNTSGTPTAIFPTSYAAYVVDASQVLLLSTDSHATHVLLSGTAEVQTAGGFSNASLSGAVLGSVNTTADPAALGVPLGAVSSTGLATVFRATATGDGNCTVTHVDIAGGSQLGAAVEATGTSGVGITALVNARQATGAAGCVVTANGRGVLTPPAPNNAIGSALSSTGLTASAEAPRVFYLAAPGRGYFLETGYAALGSFEPQTVGSSSLGLLSGPYRFGTGTASSAASVDGSGVMTADGAGSATVVADVGLNSDGSLQTAASQTLSYSLTDAAAGRFTLGSTVLYAVTQDRLLRLDMSATTPSPNIGSVQR